MAIPEVETINLKDIIRDIKKNKKVEAIYLFGSRAYKTKSNRSDFDIILVGDIDSNYSNSLYEKYEYLDIFLQIGEKSIYSNISGSSISCSENRDLFEELDAKLLWSKKEKYQNSDLFIQSHYYGQRHFPSARPLPKSIYDLKQKLNDAIVSDDVKFYIQEALVDFSNESFLSCVSILGLACESTLIELSNSYKKRIMSIDASNTTYQRDVINAVKTKQRLEQLKYFFDYYNEKSYIKTHNLNIKLDEVMTFFDVIRMYRNDADHPSGFSFGMGTCLNILMQIDLNILDIYKLIKHYNETYR